MNFYLMCMSVTTALISGTAMAVIVGAIMIIAPWTIDAGGFFAKLLVGIVGFVFVLAALWFSKG